MDREWSSQPLAATQKGWDWFSLHLSSGEKLMVFRLRDGTSHDFCAGTWIGADGAQQALDRNDIALAPLSETHLAGRVLPVRWKLVVKSRRDRRRNGAGERRQLDGDKLPLLGRPDHLSRLSRGERILGDDGLLSTTDGAAGTPGNLSSVGASMMMSIEERNSGPDRLGFSPRGSFIG